MSTQTFTKTTPPDWVLAFWKEIDDKTFGKGFELLHEGCRLQPRRCRLARARRRSAENLRAFITIPGSPLTTM